MEGQIHLRWTSHQGTILAVFDALLADESMVDVTLACEGQYIRAHKVILSACSPYFQDLVNLDSNKHPIIFLKDVKFVHLQVLIQYMYRGEVNIPHADLPLFLEVANALKIRGLVEVESDDNTTSTVVDQGMKNRMTTPQQPPLAVPVTSGSMVTEQIIIPSYAQRPSFAERTRSSTHILAPAPAGSPPPIRKPQLERRSTRLQKSQVNPLAQYESASTTQTTSYATPLSQSQTKIDEVKLEDISVPEVSLDEENNSPMQFGFPESVSYEEDQDENSGMDNEDGVEYDGEIAEDSGVVDSANDAFYECARCGKTYAKYQQKQFYHHRVYDCLTLEPKFHCEICPYRARRRFTLKKHYLARHRDPDELLE